MIQPLIDAPAAGEEEGIAPAVGVKRTGRASQRSALRDLAELAAQGAAAEQAIEQKHRHSIEQLAEDLKKALDDLEQERQVSQQAIAIRHAERIKVIEAEFTARSAALDKADADAAHRLRVHDAALERTIQREYEQEKWLADSVLEVNQSQLHAESAAARKELSEQVRALETTASQAAELMQGYGIDPALEPQAVAATNSIPPEQAGEIFLQRRSGVERDLQILRRLKSPRLFVGILPVLLLALLCLAAAAAAQWEAGTIPWSNFSAFHPAWRPIGYTLAATIAVAMVAGFLLRRLSHRRLRETYRALLGDLATAQEAAGRQTEFIDQTEQRKADEAGAKHRQEVRRVRDKHMPALNQSRHKRDAALAEMKRRHDEQLDAARAQHDRHKAEADTQKQRQEDQGAVQYRKERDRLQLQHDQRRQGVDQEYEQARHNSARRLEQGLAHARAPIAEQTAGAMSHDWSDSAWRNWTPPKQFTSLIRFGSIRIDLQQIAAGAGGDHSPGSLALPQPFDTPAFLAFPEQASLMIRHNPPGREQALRTLQAVMVRLLTGLPPGRVRFTLIDPVGLGQNFAGFMHLADYDDALIGGRIWTESAQIDQRLADLTEHMETVIQKYLRNEYPTIDDYNAQAGELAEPYRFLVIADFPTGFSEDSLRRLASIAASGARCGVYTLIACDQRQKLSQSLLDDLAARSIHLVSADSVRGENPAEFIWQDDVFGQFPLTLDQPPEEDVLTQLMERVGQAAKQAKRIEEPFSSIAPPPEQLWSRKSADGVAVAIGRTGATRLQSLRLGHGVAQHALIAGKTGSGKSTLLHALITNLALWYSPDEIELYLIDFKRGVEFKTYASHALPHARAVAVESDREFGLSVLQRLDAELGRRGDLFRKAGAQDLPGYRQSAQSPMPRVLLIIDEFQEFFTEEDRLSQEAALLLDRLVRQGRAFGIHLLLGSQTLSGASGLARSTLGQMAVRIALQTSEADSQLILGDNNSAARLLDRPGEAIYNDAGGLVEANSPFQVAWLDDAERDKQLNRVTELAQQRRIQTPPPIVFEGNAPADIAQNRPLARMLQQKPTAVPSAPRAFLGDPVAIKEPTSVSLRRQSGSNLLIIGQQDQSALAMLAGALISLAAQYPPAGARFHILDATPADSPLAGQFEQLAKALHHEIRLVPWRDSAAAIDELATELQKRQDEESAAGAPPEGTSEPASRPDHFVFLNGLQRYRILRKGEEDFSFSSESEDKPADPSKQFADLLREGPALGLHFLVWCDTPASVERTLDRAALREFDHRVLFQMSANDSSNLIDSPAANKLGFHRALAFSEEQGTLEKFRPYALPNRAWLEQFA
jgi:DNA segregation ATPase FtsK/SpoIIIE-like protein